jgi:CheY-specific phosphatase CheX
MKTEHLNAFLVPSVQVLKKMAHTAVRMGPILRLDRLETGDGLNIVIGLQGRLSGSVVLTVPRGVAWALASRIAGQALSEENEAEVRAILGELANTIVGNATGYLYQAGVRQGITPPTVVMGAEICFAFGEGVESARVRLDTYVGGLDIVVSLTRESA